MGLRRIIVLLIALVAAGGSAMYARSWIEGQQAGMQAVAAPAPKEEIHEVLVADSRPARRHLRQASAPALAALADR
jgi:Flp pilus assembly protein CpaB